MRDDQEYTVSTTRQVGDFTITHEVTYRKAEPEVIPEWVTPKMILDREEYFAEAARMGHGIEWNGPWWPPEPPTFKPNPRFAAVFRKFLAAYRAVEGVRDNAIREWTPAGVGALPQAFVPQEEREARLRVQIEDWLTIREWTR